jgi:chorismate--pyruvate lyase
VSDLSPWLTADRLAAPLDVSVRDWLFEPGSLTLRLTTLAGGDFSVRPLLEGWHSLRDDECAALGLAPGSTGWVREVYLCGHGEPWVFARSVASREALQALELDLQHLGKRPLGHLLFSDKAFGRSPFEICHYPPAWLPAEVSQAGLWARRSCFQRGAVGVLVAEIFLPPHWRAVRATDDNL